MKKTIAMLMCALLICALLAGCGGSGKSGDTAPTTSESITPGDAGGASDAAEQGGEQAPGAAGSKYTFTFKDTEVAVNGDMAPLAEKLGEPGDYFESESCAFQGLDKVYTYGSVIIRTYPKDGKDYVLSVELKDDTVTTREGVYIGQTRDDVTAAYGDPGEETAAALRYVDGDCTLTFLLTDGKVTDITYTSDAA